MTRFDSLKIWQQILLVNVATLVGVIVSLFAAPPDTPVWMWAVGSTLAVVSLNCVYIQYRRRRARHGRAAYDPRPGRIILRVVLPLFVLYVILSYYLWHR